MRPASDVYVTFSGLRYVALSSNSSAEQAGPVSQTSFCRGRNKGWDSDLAFCRTWEKVRCVVTPRVPRAQHLSRPGSWRSRPSPSPFSWSAPWQYSGLLCMTRAATPYPLPHRHPQLPGVRDPYSPLSPRHQSQLGDKEQLMTCGRSSLRRQLRRSLACRWRCSSMGTP